MAKEKMTVNQVKLGVCIVLFLVFGLDFVLRCIIDIPEAIQRYQMTKVYTQAVIGQLVDSDYNTDEEISDSGIITGETEEAYTFEYKYHGRTFLFTRENKYIDEGDALDYDIEYNEKSVPLFIKPSNPESVKLACEIQGSGLLICRVLIAGVFWLVFLIGLIICIHDVINEYKEGKQEVLCQ